MLAAILLNPFAPPPDELNVSGQLFGSVGTSWNRTWAEEYGPDVDKARKAGKDEVRIAIMAIAQAPEREALEDAKEIVERRSLATELMKNDTDLVAVMTAYYAYQRRKKKQNDIAAILLLS